MKFLLLLLVILLAVWLWRSGRGSRTDAAPRAGRRPDPAQPRPVAPQDMVRCAHCGLHLPLSEAVTSSSAHYCSAEHRRLAEPGTY